VSLVTAADRWTFSTFDVQKS